jgi:hypothetical protein
MRQAHETNVGRLGPLQYQGLTRAVVADACPWAGLPRVIPNHLSKSLKKEHFVQIKKNEEGDQSKQIFRHWVEVRELKTGSVRQLPLTTVVSISLAPKRLEPQCPRKEVLQLTDGSATIEAKDLDDLAAQLRQKYPDQAYVRTLHRQRDPEAEKRRADAINKLSEVLVPRAYLEALYVIQAELERAGPEPKVPDRELEREAARRGIATIDAGKWKQRDTWVHLPPSCIRQILEMFVSGKTSLVDECPPKRRRNKPKAAK